MHGHLGRCSCRCSSVLAVGCLLCVPMMLNSEDDTKKDKKDFCASPYGFHAFFVRDMRWLQGTKKEKAKKSAMAATMNVAIAGCLPATQGDRKYQEEEDEAREEEEAQQEAEEHAQP